MAKVNNIDFNVQEDFENLLQELDTMRKMMMKITTHVKSLQKKRYKMRRSTKMRSGFTKPVRISKDLAELIGAEHFELVPRNVVNKKINEYIQRNNLQIEGARQTFKIDTNLSKVFNLPIDDTLHYFKMQTYLKHHYPKDDVSIGVDIQT